MAIVRSGEGVVDWLALSDALIVAETSIGVEVITDSRVEEAVADLQQAVRDAPVGSEEHEAQKRRMVTAQRRKRNVPGGYWGAGASPLAADEAMTGS